VQESNQDFRSEITKMRTSVEETYQEFEFYGSQLNHLRQENDALRVELEALKATAEKE
jgi:regulator of replication initiation timing